MNSEQSLKVTSHAEVWIEIIIGSIKNGLFVVTSHAEVWIEI